VHKNALWAGVQPRTPLGELTALLWTLAGLKGLLLRRWERKERKERTERPCRSSENPLK